MAEINGSLQGSQALQSLFHALDPISLIVSENSRADDQPLVPLTLKTETETYFVMERGPRYRAYAELREAKLRRKHMRQPETDGHEPAQTPPRKQVKFGGCSVGGGARRGPSILTQSVPDFSSVMRKENRKPTNALPPLVEMTPPSKNWPKASPFSSSARGSKSANAGEKKGGMMVRKSYACIEELKVPIGGDRGRSLRGTRRTVLGSRAI